MRLYEWAGRRVISFERQSKHPSEAASGQSVALLDTLALSGGTSQGSLPHADGGIQAHANNFILACQAACAAAVVI
ncbi:MAG: hypothetical protein HY791_25045 [Deltaproteobacteria bacterium]|nr:hypothetical protein [Deltaproteobacteria bacterium]